MLIYPCSKSKSQKVSYSIKSQNIMKKFISYIRLQRLKKNYRYQRNLHYDYINFDNAFSNKDRIPIVDFDHSKHLGTDYQLLYSITTETHLSFISNNSLFYDNDYDFYFKTGKMYLTPFSFTETYQYFHRKLEYKLILEKPLVLKLGLFGTYLENRYSRKRTINYKDK